MNTHFIYRLFIGLAFPAFLTLNSCQQVIDIDLDEADRRYVVDGTVYEGADSIVVRLTKTTSYFDTAEPEGVNGADVKVTMPGGEVVTLNAAGNGVYKADGLTITTESTYALEVHVDDQVFTATTYMMPSVSLDTLDYEYDEGFAGEEGGYSVFATFQDEIGPNFYRILSSVNGHPLNESDDLLQVDDNLNDGNLIRIPIWTHQYEPGDTVEVEVQSIDAELYEFYQTFAAIAGEAAGSPFSAAPANPESNVEGGALGVFGAYTSSKRTIIIPQ